MKKGIIRRCRVCKKRFYLFPYRIKDKSRGIFCSKKCQVVGRNKTNIGRNPNSHKMTEKTKEKISKALEGKTPKNFYDMQRKGWKASKGHIPWNKGKKGTHFSVMTEFKIGHIPAMKGRGVYCKLSELIRSCLKYREWRSGVYFRDKWTCQICGYRGRHIHADHIKQFALILRENDIRTLVQAEECSELWRIENGRTLCIDCHQKTGSYFRPLFRNYHKI